MNVKFINTYSVHANNNYKINQTMDLFCKTALLMDLICKKIVKINHTLKRKLWDFVKCLLQKCA